MKTAILLLTLSTAAYAAEKSFDRTLTTSSSPSVSVETGSGNVHLHPGSGNQIHIYARMHSSHGWLGSSESDVESRMQRIANEPPIRQNGNSVTVGERNNDDLYRNISIDYDITLPRAATLDAHTGSGDITVSGTPAIDWKLQTGSGNLRLNLGSKAHFTLDANTGSGSVHTDQPIMMQGSLDKHHVRGAVNGGGPTLSAHTGSGDIEIR